MPDITLNDAIKLINELGAIALSDKEGKFKYVNRNYEKFMHMNLDKLKNMYLWDPVPTSKSRIVMQTHTAIIGEPVKINGCDSFCSYYPIFENGEFDGILICVVFSTIDVAANFAKKVYSLENELKSLREVSPYNLKAHYSISNIIGNSSAIQQLKEDIIAASRTPSTVLIEGETGVGKELVAHSIHNLSTRCEKHFVRVNCSAIPPNLMESEFFGYEGGAFTGAQKSGKPGKFELANGGGLFLDEINQLSYEMQPKFLRVLQENEVERVGGKSAIPIDVRIITATNIPLEKLIKSGDFRVDLYYRLNVIQIKVPPLRERMEDIPLLSRNILHKLNYKLGTDVSEISEEVYDLFSHYSWPGNVRELQNIIESAVNRAYNTPLTLKHFENFKKVVYDNAPIVSTFPITANVAPITQEYDILVQALKKCNNNRVETAKYLGISRSALYNKLKKYSM